MGHGAWSMEHGVESRENTEVNYRRRKVLPEVIRNQ